MVSDDDLWIPISLDGIAPPSTTGAAGGPVAHAAMEAAPSALPAAKAATPGAIQDEWGFFDPDQCGFAALIAKLDEVTADDDKRRNAETSVRVISCS